MSKLCLVCFLWACVTSGEPATFIDYPLIFPSTQPATSQPSLTVEEEILLLKTRDIQLESKILEQRMDIIELQLKVNELQELICPHVPNPDQSDSHA